MIKSARNAPPGNEVEDLINNYACGGGMLESAAKQSLPSTTYQLSSTMYAYFDPVKAAEYGCYVYTRVDGQSVFATDVCTQREQHPGVRDVGMVTHCKGPWQCGRLLIGRRTENPDRKTCPSDEFISRADEFIAISNTMTSDVQMNFEPDLFEGNAIAQRKAKRKMRE